MTRREAFLVGFIIYALIKPTDAEASSDTDRRVVAALESIAESLKKCR